MTVRLTRRGYATLAVALIAVGFAAHSGPRSLNAVAGPALVAVGFAWLTLRRRREPTVTRRRPVPGFPGETREIELRVDAAGRAQVTDEVGEGLARVGPIQPGGYSVELRERGARRLGPATVRETDAFGLLATETTAGGRTELLVYPPVEPLVPNRAFRGLVDRAGSPDRDAFESLREYTPGDPLRDVHWKSSAKREPGELVVTQYATPDQGAVTVVAEAAEGRADAMASAAASVVVYLLEAGIAVEVVAPDGTTDRGRGEDARDEALELLARTGAGRPGVDGDVRLAAPAGTDEVRVATRGESFPFADLRADDDSEAAHDERQEVVSP
ncbi:DUF58 domain-containing protein [Halosegnis sp.]|uniref:DUF58 domain-containing protein n=1 Tax=Halosegnis sp. TaxID=2864959 RepID=UPI0035D46FFB